MKYKKAYQTFFCVFGVCYGTGTSVGQIYLEETSYVSYVVHDESKQFQNPCLDIDHIKGHVKLRAMKPGGRALEDILVVTGEDLKTKTKPEAERKFMEICAQVNPDIDTDQLTKPDMIILAQEAFIGARSPRKKIMRSSSGVFRNSPVKHQNSGLDLIKSPTLDLSMLKEIPVKESDLHSNLDSDKLSTASGLTPISSGDSDGSKTPSINGDLSDPAGSDVPEISSDVSEEHSECDSVETNSVIQEVTIDEELKLNEVNVNKVSVGVNTEQDVNPSENSVVNQVNYGGNESEINSTKSNANFDSVDYKRFDPNEFIRFLLESIERSRLALKSLRRKLLGKIAL